MPEITKVTKGSLAKNKKLNEVIKIVNAIGFNMTVRAGVNDETPQLIVSDNNAELIVSAGGGSGGGSGDNIDVIWCIDGEPYNGTVVGEIGDPV